jgi:hypothetical protein
LSERLFDSLFDVRSFSLVIADLMYYHKEGMNRFWTLHFLNRGKYPQVWQHCILTRRL